MRIAFNAQRMAGQRFGVGRYVEYMIRHWSQMLAPDDKLTIFLRKPLKGFGDLGPQVEQRVLGPDMSGLPWETLVLRRPAAEHDVLFCPAYSAPLCFRGRLVVANHSVNETEPDAHDWLYRQTYARLYRHCARVADAVIVPGEKVRAAVAQHYRVPDEKLHIVHQGTSADFVPTTDEALLSRTRQGFFGHDRPYLLFVGKGSQRRNIPMLVTAYAKLRREAGIPHGLVLFGPYLGDPPIEELARSLGVGDDVVRTDGVIAEHRDIVPVYGAASIFVQPSENEGWSMTTVEALACGVPVIASNRGGLAETTGGQALLLDRPNVDSLAAAILSVLNDDALRADLSRRAVERGRALRWDVLARQTLDIVKAAGAR